MVVQLIYYLTCDVHVEYYNHVEENHLFCVHGRIQLPIWIILYLDENWGIIDFSVVTNLYMMMK